MAKSITKTYRVAGLDFSLTLPDSELLWNAIENAYSPFLVGEGDKTDAPFLFALEFREELPEGTRTCIYNPETADGETSVTLYRQGSGWVFESRPDHRRPVTSAVWASEDFNKAYIRLASRRLSDAVFSINNAVMLLYAFSSARFGTIEMHASVIGNSGRAWLFLGKSGTGKSTHSRLWLENVPGSELVNDDNPVVRVMPDGRILAFGSPWSGKTPCYRNVCFPVGAFVQIRQCPHNAISKMKVLEGYSSLYSSTSGIKDDDSPMADRINDTMDKILSSIPFWLLDCRPDREAAELCARTVRNA